MAAGMGNYLLPHPPLESKVKSLLPKRQKKKSRKTKIDIEPEELGMRIGSMGIGTGLGTDGMGLGTDETGKTIQKLTLEGIDLNLEHLKLSC